MTRKKKRKLAREAARPRRFVGTWRPGMKVRKGDVVEPTRDRNMCWVFGQTRPPVEPLP